MEWVRLTNRVTSPLTADNYIFEAVECDELIVAEPEATPYLRPYVGAR